MTDNRGLRQFTYQLEWGGARMGFSELTALDLTKLRAESPVVRRQALDKVSGFDKSLTITLKRGVIQTDGEFNDWLSSVRKQSAGIQHDVTLHAYNAYREPVASWILTRCAPGKMQSPSLKASGNEVAMESLEIIHQGVQSLDVLEALSSSLESRSPTTALCLLFYGATGTGKAVAVARLAKESKREILRVDLSQLISKYIGETEKNLARVFELAQHARGILFFDEADALFGKRTDVKNANDRFANQEVSYLLQRIEYFDGIVIIATNTRPDHEHPLLRRMDIVVPFPLSLSDS